MKKLLLVLCTLAILATSCFLLVGCGESEPNTPEVTTQTITIYDGENQVASVKSKEDLIKELNKSVSKTGKRFVNFYLDKECNKVFDIDNMPEGDFAIYFGWEDLEMFNKITANFDATLDIGLGIPVVVNAGATVSFRLTDEGVDLVVDAKASLLGAEYDAKIYYVDGVFALGLVDEEDTMQYEITEVGTLKDIAMQTLSNPKVKAVYDFVVDILQKNGVTLDVNTLKSMLIFEPDLDEKVKTDIADDLQPVIDFLVENRDQTIIDVIVVEIIKGMDVPSEEIETYVPIFKNVIYSAVDGIFNDEITIGDIFDVVMGLIDPEQDIDSIIASIDALQAQIQLETQDVIDLINVLFDVELPKAEEDQTVMGYAMTQLNGLAFLMFNETSVLDVKLCDIVSLIVGDPVSLNDIATYVKWGLENITVETVVDLIGNAVSIEFEINDFYETLASIDLTKLEFSAGAKTNALGLISELSLGTSDVVKVGADTYSVDASLVIAIEYGVYGEDVFVIPTVA